MPPLTLHHAPLPQENRRGYWDLRQWRSVKWLRGLGAWRELRSLCGCAALSFARAKQHGLQDIGKPRDHDCVYRLAGETLDLIGFGVEPKPTTAYLAANDEVLWSIGSNDALYTKDGQTWISVALPS